MEYKVKYHTCCNKSPECDLQDTLAWPAEVLAEDLMQQRSVPIVHRTVGKQPLIHYCHKKIFLPQLK